MCGICGVVDFHRPEAVDPRVLSAMNAALRHRGPDEEGTYRAPHVGLAMRRLRVIDPSGGGQPMGNEDGSVWVVYNGEIYNFRELREDLIRRGHRFRARSDTEVIVHAYEEDGEECVARFRGMFAFALWDARRTRLLLARDRLGVKPLYYRCDGARVAFASELKALLHLPGPRWPSLRSLDLYLTFGYVPSPATIFDGVHKLPPAHVLVAEEGGVRVRRYWDVVLADRSGMSLEEASRALRRRLEDTVRAHLVSDVPVGAFLSGGLDSSTVVALMSRVSPHPVRTFSIGFREGDANELPDARVVAALYGTDHHEVLVEPRAVGRLPELLRHFDEPFGDSSALPTYLVSEAARAEVTVVLTGDGGDEVFGGYEWQRRHQMTEALRVLPGPLRSVLPALAPLGPWPRERRERVRAFLEDAVRSPEDGYLRRMTLFDRGAREALYTREVAQEVAGWDSREVLRSWIRSLPRTDFRNRMLYADTHFYCPEDCLTKVDRMTMAWSLEARVPLLDHGLVEFMGSLPPGWKLHGFTSKYLLRRAVRDLLPPRLLRKRKRGFSIPVGSWLRGPLREAVRDLLLDAAARRRGWFRPEAVERLLREHESGVRDHGHRLYALLALEVWARSSLDQVPETVPAGV